MRRSLVAVCLASAGSAWSQTTPPPSPTDPPATATPPAPAAPKPAEPASKPAEQGPSDDGPIEPEATILLKDGREMTGFVVSRNGQEVRLRIAGIITPVPRDQIGTIEFLPPVEERYRALRAKVADTDVDGRIMLVNWLVARSRFELAQQEAEAITDDFPDHAEAKRVRAVVEQQAMLAKNRPGRKDPEHEAVPERRERAEFPTLHPDESNLLRVFQVNLNDPPKMTVSRELVEELIRRYKDRPPMPQTAEGREALYRARPEQILKLAFELRARELYGMVKVTEEPRSLKLFRANVWRGWVLNSCATNSCHGGQEAGRLWMLNRKTNADSTVYTNYIILHDYKLADGTPLLNYEKPSESPLLQMALPPDVSKRKHPTVKFVNGAKGYAPPFHGPEDRRFQETVEWLRSIEVPEGREYPLAYKPPTPKPVLGSPTGGEPSKSGAPGGTEGSKPSDGIKR